MSTIIYPFIPEGKQILYVPASNKYMALAKAFARAQSLDSLMPGAAVIVNEGRVIGLGANGSEYHTNPGCERVRLNCPTGEGYDLCPGCSPENHSERRAINSATAQNANLNNADLYLWGHWWFCKDCWSCMIASNIANCYLMERSNILFDKTNPGNIIGMQFL